MAADRKFTQGMPVSAPLSVIIPTFEPGPALGACVHSLFEGLENAVVAQLVLSDGGTKGGLVDLAGDLGAVLVSGPMGRGGQLRRGAKAANTRWLLFLHSDTVLSAGWSAAVVHHLNHHANKAGYFDLRFNATGFAPRFVAGWANLRSRLLGLPYGDQGLLISRRLYDEIGGFDDIPLMEDVAIAARLRGRLRAVGSVAVTSADTYLRDGWLRRGVQNFRTIRRYFRGDDPAKLAHEYYRQK